MDTEEQAAHGIGEEESNMQITMTQIFQSIQASTCLLAQDALSSDSFGLNTLLRHLTAVTIFSLVGIIVLAICIYLFDRIVPFSFRKEILEDQNTALGIIVAAVLLGMSIIIAAAIQG